MIHPSFVLLLFFNAQNEVLLLRRINTPFCNNHYSLPGGQILPHEPALTACMREAQESLGVEITPQDLEFVHVMHRKCNEPEFFACVFKVSSWNGELHNNQPERHDDLRWFALNALPEHMVPAHRHALMMVQQKMLYSEHGWK